MKIADLGPEPHGEITALSDMLLSPTFVRMDILLGDNRHTAAGIPRLEAS
jgi:hypothetical protein